MQMLLEIFQGLLSMCKPMAFLVKEGKGGGRIGSVQKKLELSTIIHHEEEYGKISYCPFIVIMPMIA
jgi:hypothetical protein